MSTNKLMTLKAGLLAAAMLMFAFAARADDPIKTEP